MVVRVRSTERQLASDKARQEMRRLQTWSWLQRLLSLQLDLVRLVVELTGHDLQDGADTLIGLSVSHVATVSCVTAQILQFVSHKTLDVYCGPPFPFSNFVRGFVRQQRLRSSASERP